MIQVGYVADRQAQYLDLGELLLRRKRRQELAQFGECHVERLHADALPCRVRSSVLFRGAAPASPLLPTQRTTVRVLLVLRSAQTRAHRSAASVRGAVHFVVRRHDVIVHPEVRLHHPGTVEDGRERECLGGRDAGCRADHACDVRGHHA